MVTAKPAGAGVLLALGAAAAYGFNITFTRIAALEGVPGPSLVFYRVLVMLALAGAVLAVARRAPTVEPSERKALGLLGLTSAGVGLCYLSSVAFIPVTVAAVLFYTFPILIVALSPLVDGTRLTLARLAVTVAAFVGVVLVVGPAWGDLNPVGLVLALGAAVAATAQFFAAGRTVRTDTWSKLLWVHVMVLPAAVAAASATGGLAPPSALALAPWSVFFNIGGFIIGFLLQLMALTRVSASAAGLAFCAEPVVAAVTAALVLGETLGPVQYVGGALVIGAIVANVLADERQNRRMAGSGAKVETNAAARSGVTDAA
ncbi:DMT family transporter [Alsobacter sp. R-9]